MPSKPSRLLTVKVVIFSRAFNSKSITFRLVNVSAVESAACISIKTNTMFESNFNTQGASEAIYLLERLSVVDNNIC